MTERHNLSCVVSSIFLSATICAMVVLIAYFIWSLDRGFEIYDESYYLLLAIYSEDVKLFVSAQHWLMAPLWKLTRSLLGFRALGLSILVLSSTILAFGAMHAYSVVTQVNISNKRERAMIMASTVSGALLYGATINFSPCYNLFAAVSAYLAVGFILLTITIKNTPSWGVYALYMFSGCAVGILMLSKFTAGLAVVFLVIVLIAFLGGNLRERVMGSLVLLFGIIVIVLTIVFSNSTISKLIEEIRFGMLVFKQVQVESTIDRLVRYAGEFFAQQLWAGMFFVVFVAYLSSAKRLSNPHSCTILTSICIVLLACIHLPQAFALNNWIGIAASLTSILAICLMLTIPIWTQDAKSIALTMGLCFLPYCVAFGTGNGIHTQIVVSIASWGTIIAIMATATKEENPRRSLSMLACIFFVSIIILRVILSGISPYNLASPIWEQSIPTKIGAIGWVKTDKLTNEFVLTITDSMGKNNISSKRPYLGFYGMPGVALIINAVPVFSPWLTNAEQSDVLLSRVNQEILHSAIFGISPGARLPKQISGFPSGYKKIGEATYPANQTIQLWISYE